MSPSGMSWKIKYTYIRAVPKVRHHSLRWPAPTVTMSFCPSLVHMSGMLTISPAISRPEPQSVPSMQLCRTCCVWYWQYGFAAESEFNGSILISISSLGVWKPTLTKMTFLIGSRSQHLCSVDDHDGTRMTLPLMHITRTAVSWPPAAARSTHVNDNDARIKSAQSWSRGSTYGSPSASAAAPSLLMAPDLSCSCQRPRASQLLPATMLVFIPIIFSNTRLILNPTFWRLFRTFLCFLV